MNIGDTVIYKGKVTDIKENSVLTVALAGDFREHWFDMSQLEVETPPAPEGSVASTTSATEITHPAAGQVDSTKTAADPNYQTALKIVMGKGYSEDAAKKIIAQVGTGPILAEEAGTPGTPHPAPGAGASHPGAALHADASDEQLAEAGKKEHTKASEHSKPRG